MTVAGQITDEQIGELLKRSTRDRDQFQPSSLSWAMHNGYVLALTELQHRREAEASTVAENVTVAPGGWVLVPREPTHEMLTHRLPGTNELHRWDVWTAMLAASPSSPASGVRVSEEQREKEAAFVAAGGAKRVEGHYSNADTGVVGTVPTEVYLSYDAQAKEIAARSVTETQTAIKNAILLFVLKARMAENELCAALIEDRGKNNVGRVHPIDAGHAAAIRSRLSALGEHP